MAGGPVVCAAVLAVALAACGSSERNGDGRGDERGGAQTSGNSGTGAAGQAGMAGGGGATTGGSAGTGTGGTGTSGASGSSAGSGVIGRSQAEACMAYAGAVCRRSDECSGITTSEPYPCSTSCPDLVFAPGSTRTVDTLFECAEVYATWPCEDYLADRFPPCVTPGTKQLGEPCAFSSQCQSVHCKLTGERCGTCARLVAENEDCTAPDAACATGFLCTSGVCRRRSPTIKQPGEPCASFADCDQSNARCNEQGICELYPGENESCAIGNACTSEFYCTVPDQICRRRPGLGEPCGDDARTNVPACAGGLLCTAAMSPDPGTCVAPTSVEVGGDCTSPTTFCAPGGTCLCIDRTTCTEKHCVSARLLGQNCTATDPCDPVLTCVDGTCVPIGYQNIFENACGQ